LLRHPTVFLYPPHRIFPVTPPLPLLVPVIPENVGTRRGIVQSQFGIHHGAVPLALFHHVPGPGLVFLGHGVVHPGIAPERMAVGTVSQLVNVFQPPLYIGGVIIFPDTGVVGFPVFRAGIVLAELLHLGMKETAPR